MAHWIRQNQEREGEKYFFNGLFYCTRAVSMELTEVEIAFLYLDVINYAQESNGIDYLQIYRDDQNRTLYFIDNLSEIQINSGNYSQEENYCTLLFSHEY
ncbi:MAG: hypothetical protein JNM95_11220 [Chitinophagaceae bacterium]|nr:hypothetical protein [Chitinophagaceae bacterium]